MVQSCVDNLTYPYPFFPFSFSFSPHLPLSSLSLSPILLSLSSQWINVVHEASSIVNLHTLVRLFPSLSNFTATSPKPPYTANVEETTHASPQSNPISSSSVHLLQQVLALLSSSHHSLSTSTHIARESGQKLT